MVPPDIVAKRAMLPGGIGVEGVPTGAEEVSVGSVSAGDVVPGVVFAGAAGDAAGTPQAVNNISTVTMNPTIDLLLTIVFMSVPAFYQVSSSRMLSHIAA
ncbi:MAG: hypothetical protein PHN78_03940 [Dehalococcoidales bacterium]|nr:hypothetical protein [Dehalococcoidales bacterium]